MLCCQAINKYLIISHYNLISAKDPKIKTFNSISMSNEFNAISRADVKLTL